MRDHIFISYATEQAALCDWLARRLAAEGYAVWSDRLKLLGGENWPNDIDEAIDNRTFRMLALLSRASLKKQNPQGEWLKGNAIGKKLGIDDFVIPLNTEGLRPDEISWNLQPINYISFAPSWAEGLTALLRKLRSIDAPRSLSGGRKLAIKSVALTREIENEKEVLVSNCFEIVQIPRFIRKYTIVSSPLSQNERRTLREEWACRDITRYCVFAFHDPPASIKSHHDFQYAGQISWCDREFLNGNDTTHVVISLIRRCLDHLLKGRKMHFCDIQKQWYLPRGLLDHDRVTVTFPDGKKTWFKGVSERTYRSGGETEVYRYHLSPSFDVSYDHEGAFVLSLRNRVYLSDKNGVPFDRRKIVSRRKHLCKGWFNKEWFARTLGIVQFLAGKDGYLRFGPEGNQQLVINAMPITLDAPRRIRDELVDDPSGVSASLHEDDADVVGTGE